MDRAMAATAYTERVTQVVSDLSRSGLEVNHPLLEGHETSENGLLLVLTANRGLCGGYNGNAVRLGLTRHRELSDQMNLRFEVSGRRGVSAYKFREVPVDEAFTQFEDQPKFDQVEPIATRYLDAYSSGKIDRLDVAYTQFVSVSRQIAVVETLLPLGSLSDSSAKDDPKDAAESGESMYEFLPSAASILQEVVPMSFKVRLFKCFLDAAVSEQISRMVAMKSATENASDIIKHLSMTYNRARQSQITGEIMEVIGGAEALSG
jgi:F-type H+-transporting ATPase subunit gamma